MSAEEACECCLRRAWLLARLAAHLERVRGRINSVLALGDEELLAAVGGRRQAAIRAQIARLNSTELRSRAEGSGVELICRCNQRYPARLHALPSPPAVLHVRGGLDRFLALTRADPVAIVGARRPSSYGLEVARSLGRELASAGLTVISGMALGIDSAAHNGALAAHAPTVAVLPGPADQPYPATKRALYRQITVAGAAVSELAPGAGVWRWAFPARNRVIAALAAMTVVVEAGERSGALMTAACADELGRPVGAVPGRVTSRQAAGSNGLLAAGAQLIRGAQDVLDSIFGAGARTADTEVRAELGPELRPVLEAVADGHDTAAALVRAGFGAEQGLAALASLELAGYVRRGFGGRFVLVP